MNYDETILKRITSCAVFGYDYNKIMNVLDLDEKQQKEFLKDIQNPQHQVSRSYRKGIDQADFAIDSALFQKVQKGDLKALAIFEERREKLKHKS